VIKNTAVLMIYSILAILDFDFSNDDDGTVVIAIVLIILLVIMALVIDLTFGQLLNL
jgi:hypothetical protein